MGLRENEGDECWKRKALSDGWGEEDLDGGRKGWWKLEEILMVFFQCFCRVELVFQWLKSTVTSHRKILKRHLMKKP